MEVTRDSRRRLPEEDNANKVGPWHQWDREEGSAHWSLAESAGVVVAGLAHSRKEGRWARRGSAGVGPLRGRSGPPCGPERKERRGMSPCSISHLKFLFNV